MKSAAVDAITAEVVSRRLLSVAEEMGVALIRSAFSANIKERADCSTAIFDAKGRVVAQAQRVPIHLGSMIGAVDAIRERFGEALAPGDMFAVNDPYNGGGSHLPDINVVAPAFHDGEIVAFVANIAHHADVGGMMPGSEAAVCRSIFQEGLRLPPVRIARAGAPVADMVEVICLNSRAPDERLGDLNAQFAANVVGVAGVEALFDAYGEAAAPAIEAYLNFTRRRFEAAIGKLRRGVFSASDYLDGDADGERALVAATLTVEDRRLRFDFAGSAPQLSWARNIPHQALLATIYTVAKSLLDPDAPANAGYFETIDVAAEAGSIVNPTAPAPVGCRSISAGVLGDVIAAALSQAQPGKAIAGSGPHHLAIFHGLDPKTGQEFVNYETVAGGMGARPDRDGMDAVRVHASGAANLPIEALEHAYPLRVERYAIRKGSGGAGRHAGGAGVVRDYRALVDGVTLSLSAERQTTPAPGHDGAAAGAPGAFVLNPDSADERRLRSAEADLPLPVGAVLSIRTPGGGGFGAPDPSDAETEDR